VNIVRVGYKGGGGMMNAAISGEVQVVFGAAGLVKPHAASGRLRALAVCNTEPSALMPGLPTVAESGLPGYKSESLFAVFAPAMTPAAIVSRLNQEILRVLNSAQMKERFVNGGVEIVASSPEQLTATIKSDIVSIGKLVKDAGIRVQ
jgi:tripartite-type tricarboxylate transporter receptor subunit TctC